jgi:hypothetical protein
MRLPKEIIIDLPDLIEGTLMSEGKVRFDVYHKRGVLRIYCKVDDMPCILGAVQAVKEDVAAAWRRVKTAFERGAA